jgi:hypothetical protein
VPTGWRPLAETPRRERALGKITAAVNVARRRSAFTDVRAAGKVVDDVTCIRLDASVMEAYAKPGC